MSETEGGLYREDGAIKTRREMTLAEAGAVLTLVRGGWLKLELNLEES